MRLGRRTLPEPPVDPVNPESAWRWHVSPLTMALACALMIAGLFVGGSCNEA